MRNKIVILKILCWGEMMVAVKLLFFTIPFVFKGNEMAFTTPHPTAYKFAFLLTFLSLLYFMSGFAALIGHRWWKWFHLFSAVIIAFMTWSLLNFVKTMSSDFDFLYLIPVTASTVILGLIFIFGRTLRAI